MLILRNALALDNVDFRSFTDSWNFDFNVIIAPPKDFDFT